MEIIFRKTIEKEDFDVYGVVGVISNNSLLEKHKHVVLLSDNLITSFVKNHSDMSEILDNPYEGLLDTMLLGDIVKLNVFNGMTSEGIQFFSRNTAFEDIKMFSGIAFLKKNTPIKTHFKYRLNEFNQFIEVEDLISSCIGKDYSSLLTEHSWNIDNIDYHIVSTLANDVIKEVFLYNYLSSKKRVKNNLSIKEENFISKIKNSGYIDGIVSPKSDSGYYNFLYINGKLNRTQNIYILEDYIENYSIDNLDFSSLSL